MSFGGLADRGSSSGAQALLRSKYWEQSYVG
jgi:hypothetical protein